MADTILITGASTGIGKATAIFFHEKGWNVVATMRRPEAEEELTKLDNVLVTRLDVTDHASIQAAVTATLDRFGQIDVLVNNAGYGAFGPLEAFPMANIERQFDTNVIGLLAVTQAVIPHFRARRTGTLVNISSIGGRMTLPLGALYHGTKFAVEGITEALGFEFSTFGGKVKIVEPGRIETDFATRSFDFVNDDTIADYQPVVQALMAMAGDTEAPASPPSLVAETIWEAVTDGTDKLRYPSGPDAHDYMTARSEQDDATFLAAMRTRFGL